MSCLEYAVSELKVRAILVCGHYGCGAVRAALRLPSKTQGLVSCWINDIRHCRDLHHDQLRALEPDAQVDRLCELNVMRQTFHVCTSPMVQAAWDRGQQLEVHGIIYSLKDGLIRKLVGPIKAPTLAPVPGAWPVAPPSDAASELLPKQQPHSDSRSPHGFATTSSPAASSRSNIDARAAAAASPHARAFEAASAFGVPGPGSGGSFTALRNQMTSLGLSVAAADGDSRRLSFTFSPRAAPGSPCSSPRNNSPGPGAASPHMQRAVTSGGGVLGSPGEDGFGNAPPGGAPAAQQVAAAARGTWVREGRTGGRGSLEIPRGASSPLAYQGLRSGGSGSPAVSPPPPQHYQPSLARPSSFGAHQPGAFGSLMTGAAAAALSSSPDLVRSGARGVVREVAGPDVLLDADDVEPVAPARASRTLPVRASVDMGPRDEGVAVTVSGYVAVAEGATAGDDAAEVSDCEQVYGDDLHTLEVAQMVAAHVAWGAEAAASGVSGH